MIYGNNYEEKRSWGEALRRRRLQKHMSQAALATAVGLAPNSISQYEINGMGVSLLIALNIVDALDWSIDEWEIDAIAIYDNESWRRAGRRGKREHADDYHT